MGSGVQFLSMGKKRKNLVLVQKRLAACYGQAAELRTRGVRLVEFQAYIALVHAEMLVVGLVAVEAEIAVFRAAKVDEQRCRLLARAACSACRRYPAAPYR